MQDHKPSPLSPFAAPAFRETILPAIFIGLLSLLSGLTYLYFQHAAGIKRGWPVTEGRVVGSRLQARQESSSRQSSMTVYCVVFSYAYRVDGRDFGSEAMQTCSASEDHARSLLPPADTKLQVLYNPKKPGESALGTGEPPTYYPRYVSPVLILFGLTLLALAWREFAKIGKDSARPHF